MNQQGRSAQRRGARLIALGIMRSKIRTKRLDTGHRRLPTPHNVALRIIDIM